MTVFIIKWKCWGERLFHSVCMTQIGVWHIWYHIFVLLMRIVSFCSLRILWTGLSTCIHQVRFLVVLNVELGFEGGVGVLTVLFSFSVAVRWECSLWPVIKEMFCGQGIKRGFVNGKTILGVGVWFKKDFTHPGVVSVFDPSLDGR